MSSADGTQKGAKHIYLLDINATEYDTLKVTFEKAYPNVKVSLVLSLIRVHTTGINM